MGFLILVNPKLQLEKARDSQRKAALRQIQSGLELYRSDQGAYPGSVTNCGVSLCFGTTTYIQNVPKDPENGSNYYYSYNSSAGTYVLSSCLENTRDTDGSGSSPGGPSCNPPYFYIVTNP